MRGKTLRVLAVFTLSVAITLALIFMLYKDYVMTTSIVVTVQDIPEQTKIEESMIKEIQLPVISVPPYTVRDLKEVEGKWTAKGKHIPKNGFLFYSQLAKESEVNPAERVKDDERLISIPVDLVKGLGGKINKNDKVELWYVAKGNETYAGKLLSGVEVIDVQDSKGEIIQQSDEGANVKVEPKEDNIMSMFSNSTAKGSAIPKLLTVKVPEKIVAYLLVAQKEGHIVVVGESQEVESGIQEGEAIRWLDGKKQRNLTAIEDRAVNKDTVKVKEGEK